MTNTKLVRLEQEMSQQPKRILAKANPSGRATGAPNTAQKKNLIEKVLVKEERKLGSSTTQKYCNFLISPYESEEIHEAPSITPVRQTTVRQNIVVDLADYNVGGEFYAEVRPSLSATLTLTNSAVDAQDQGAWCVDMAYDDLNDTYDDPDSGFATHLTTGNSVTFMDVSDNLGVTYKAIPVNQDVNTITTTFYVAFDPVVQPVAITVQVYALPLGGAWSSVATFLTNAGTTVNEVSNAFISPANCRAWAFRCRSFMQPYATPVHASVNIVRASGTGNVGLLQNFMVRDALGLPLQSAINDLQSWRVTAQDALVTFEGDTLNDGGAIASARVPKGWTPMTNDPYSEILAFPYDRYDGPIKHGTHVHWIPGSLDDVTPIDDPSDDYNFGAFKIVIAGRITHPDSSVRLRVCTAVAYFSTNPSYGNMEWAPPAVDMSLLLQYLARVVPAATSNDRHIIKKLAAGAAKHARAGMKYLIENPEAVAKIALLLAELL